MSLMADMMSTFIFVTFLNGGSIIYSGYTYTVVLNVS